MKLFTRSPRRASVIYLALVFIAILNLLALAYVRSIPVEANSFLRAQRATKAHYVCEAGVFDAMAYVNHAIRSGVEPALTPRAGTLMGWDWQAEIELDADSPPAGPASLRFYTVTSRAFAPGNTSAARTIRATMGEETFARYTRYIDHFVGIYYSIPSTPFIEGHVHTNTYFKMKPYPSLYSSGGPPAFNGMVTSAGNAGLDGVSYLGTDLPHDAAGEPIPGRYERLYRGGRAGLNTGVARIDLPESSGALATRAWGDATPQPTTPGLHINPDSTGGPKGGYYVVGDIDTFVLGQDPQGNAHITFTQGADTYEIIEVTVAGTSLNGVAAATGQTLVATPAGTNVYPGLGNGVHYSTGSILSLQGTNRGERLISTEISTDEEIIITGDVLRADTPPGSRPSGSRDVLGLVTYKVWLSDTIPRTSSPLYLYLSYLAGRHNDPGPQRGGFYVQSWDDTSLGVGSFRLYGAAASGQNGPTGQSDGSGNNISGFGYRQYFDPLLLEHPPPHYPTTEKLPIRSWREEDGQL